MALDYASILGASQQLVPDLRQQMMQDEAFKWERQRQEASIRQAEQQQQRQAAFQGEVETALLSNNPQDIARLMARFPEMADSIKPVWEQLDERQRATDLTQIGTIYARGQAGDAAGAAQALRSRIEADRAANMADPADEAILAGLESSDPIQQKAALATIGIQLAALTGDKFVEMYGRLNPSSEPTAVEREYNWRVGRFGQADADRWLATQDEVLVPVEPGGSIYRKSDFVGGGQPSANTGGGDRSAGAGAPVRVRSVQEAERLAPGTLFVTPDGRTMRVPGGPASAPGGFPSGE